MRQPLLIVDDDPLITDSLSFVLGNEYEVRTAANRADAVSALRIAPHPAAALIDLGLPPLPHTPDEGFGLISDILAHCPETRIIVLSGQSDETNARHARALGATEFASKPTNPDNLRKLISRVLSYKDAPSSSSTELLGFSLPMDRLKKQIRQFADSPFPVLIEGESGSGKELVAAGIHRLSGRRAGPYLALNCAAMAPNLVEAILFGHAKGAFTGASAARTGYFEEAMDGTLFLDEIGELPLELQPKLLRVLENGEFQRIGETAIRKSNARIVAATNRDLRFEVKASRFRADLYHRLSVFAITVPALRDRESDKLMLLNHFLAIYSTQTGSRSPKLAPEAEALLLRYSFPGNVRELRNIAIRLCAKHPGDQIGPNELEAEFDLEVAREVPPSSPPPLAAQELLGDTNVLLQTAVAELGTNPNFSLEARLRDIESAYIQAAQQLANNNLSQAARMLGLNRTTLYNRLEVIARHRRQS